jgi:hypothetical protein
MVAMITVNDYSRSLECWTYLLMLEKEMSSLMATLSLKWRGIEEYVNLTLQTEPSVINFIFRDGLPAD